MVFAIPLYLYVDARTPEEAQQIKAKVERLLAQPLLKQYMRTQQIPEQGWRVLDPAVAPTS
jgi:hypothetical protein